MVSRGVEPGRFVRFGCVCVLSSKQPGLTLSQRIPTDHDHAIGVVGADISLATLADFLARERVGRHGVTFIIDNNDRLVGYPRLDSVRRQVGDTITLATASEVGDPFVAQAVKLREAGAGDRFTAQLAGRTYLVAFTPLPRRFGKDWSIGVIADIGEEDRHVSPLAADPAPFPGCDEEFTRRAEALTPENVLAELKFQPHDLLRVISRTTGGKDYAQLRGSLDRLKSTIITTNIRVPRGNFDRRRDLGENSDLGLTLPEAKQLVCVQREIVAAQARDHAVLRPECPSCGGGCHVKDWQHHAVATLFGAVAVRLPRFRCISCGHNATGISWPSHCRSTPELDQLRAHLSALMPFRVAAEVLSHLLPVAAGMSPETLRGHTLKIGERLRAASAVNQVAVVPRSITVTTDSTFIRSHDDRERHLEVRVGNVETGEGGRQVFGAVARSETDIAALIRRCLDAVGRTAGATVTAFTDGCAGLQSILTYARRHAPADCRLVPYRHAAAACEAGGERIVHRRAGAPGGEDSDCRGSRAAALANLERQGEECPAHARPDPQSHACLQG